MVGGRRGVVALASVVVVAALVPISVHAGSGVVRGRLLDDDAGTPIAGVRVDACGTTGCVTGTPSDSSGEYAITLPAGAGWNVLTDTGGCDPAAYAQSHRYGVLVVDGQTTGPIDLHLTRLKSSITGHVHDEAGNPIADVSLLADNAETGGFGFGHSVSAEDGSFTVPCLAAGGVAGTGSYFITSFPPAGNAFTQQQDAGIVLRPGVNATRDIVLRTGGGSLAGRVTCAGTPCPAPISILVYCEGCASSATVMTDEAGNFVTGLLQSGQRYDVHAVGPAGWDNGIVYQQRVKTGVTTVKLTLTAADASSGKITGRITDATGAPYASCLINAFGSPSATASAGWVDGDVTTDASGTFDTGYRLAPGNYVAFLACPGWPQVQLNGGTALAVTAGSTATASYAYAETGRPFSGGFDTAGAVQPATIAYFADGSTTFTPHDAVHEYLAVQNPGPAQTLFVTYLRSSGSPIVRAHNLAASSRTTINVNADVGPNEQVSAILSAAEGFVAERSTYFGSGSGIKGGDGVMGAQALNTSFYFAEGYTGPGFDETLVLMNPDADQAAYVAVTYYFAPGTPPETVMHVVPPQRRISVHVNDPAEAGAWQQVGIHVDADIGVVAERTITFNHDGRMGVQDAMGTTELSTGLTLAEGHIGDGFDDFLSIMNPTGWATSATIGYYGWSGLLRQQTVAVPARSRITVHVNDLLSAATDFSVHLASTQPLVAERVMYFSRPAVGLSGGHVALAMPDRNLARESFFAEGYVGPGFLEDFALFNSLATAATVTVTYFPEGAAPTVRTVLVPPQSRLTLTVNQDLPAGTTHATTMTSDLPLLVERAMYFAY